MSTLIIAVLSFVGFIAAYHTYGKWLARKIFGLDPDQTVPSQELRDDVDYVPTKKEVIFGHHFTSIAGTGPIVGPAIAVFWGWLPALLWVVLGSIFIGAVHDFGALVVSLRNRGQTVGDIAGRMITPRAKLLFLIILFMALAVVLAIFGLVIAIIFALYPESVLSVWIEIPLAVGIGIWIYRRGGNILVPSIIALGIMYLGMGVGAYLFPIDLSAWFGIPLLGQTFMNAVVIWTLILFVYCFVASVLPVWTLLQPRDFINSHELVLALVLLVLGLAVAGVTGGADLFSSAPVVAPDIPPDAPPIWPFLFITIACGAISGFHCMVSSGTSSKQVASEKDAQYVGYGAMLLEGSLAVIVIIACCAGIGMGLFQRSGTGANYSFEPVLNSETGQQVRHQEAWRTRYATTQTVTNADGESTTIGGWASHTLAQKVGAFIDGSANFLASLGIPLKMGVAIMAVLVASFAATTLDTATRLQRYVIQELAQTAKIKPLRNRYVATGVALAVGGAVALMPGPKGPGSGGLILWPLFGAVNQLLAGLAFMVIVFYLLRRNRPIWFAVLPMIAMLVMPAWAMLWQMFNPNGWWANGKYLLFGFGLAVEALQVWMITEGLLIWKKARGNYPELPPLEAVSTAGGNPAFAHSGHEGD
ncbi:MAG: carbon starvation protein A [Candidatus Poribacteria bacterium]|nr:carbon starvation protein A [Candidatus Poribacteria bacterium]MDE0504367.1 carbon starvation protein A [Candidatus Poribacteria bacterium]